MVEPCEPPLAVVPFLVGTPARLFSQSGPEVWRRRLGIVPKDIHHADLAFPMTGLWPFLQPHRPSRLQVDQGTCELLGLEEPLTLLLLPLVCTGRVKLNDPHSLEPQEPCGLNPSYVLARPMGEGSPMSMASGSSPFSELLASITAVAIVIALAVITVPWSASCCCRSEFVAGRRVLHVIELVLADLAQVDVSNG